MGTENEFEKSIQQALRQWQVTPPAADWNAIERQLHPSKKRKTIWWWLPLLLAPIVAGIWMRNDPVAHTQLPSSSLPTANAPGTSIASTPAPSVAYKPTRQPASLENKTSSGTIYKKKKAQNPTSTTSYNSTNTNTGMPEPPLPANNQKIKYKEPDSGMYAAQASNQQLNENDSTTYGYDVPDSTFTVNNEQWAPSLPQLQASLANPVLLYQCSKTAWPPSEKMLHPHQLHAASTNALPKKRSFSWYWLAYASIGTTVPAEKIGGLKAATDMSVTNSNNTMLTTTSQWQPSVHLAAGGMVEKRWNNQWRLQLGLGINDSRWKVNSYTYRDSFGMATGSSIRTVIEQKNEQYRMTMLEVPAMVAGRVAGKKVGSLWWTAGLNNQWVLRLQQEQVLRSQSNNFSSLTTTQSMNQQTRQWQPQWRLGLMYDHTGKKMSWQLLPLINYSLPAVFKSGASYLLLQYHLQWRVAWPRKK